MTDVEHALDLDVEFRAIPVFGLVGVVAEGVGRSRFDSAHFTPRNRPDCGNLGAQGRGAQARFRGGATRNLTEQRVIGTPVDFALVKNGFVL
jgi:hypothetical protein